MISSEGDVHKKYIWSIITLVLNNDYDKRHQSLPIERVLKYDAVTVLVIYEMLYLQ